MLSAHLTAALTAARPLVADAHGGVAGQGRTASGLVRERRDARLVQEVPRVGFEPSFHGLAVLDTEDLDPGRRDLSAGRRSTHELAHVRTSIGPAYGDPIAGDEHVLDGGDEIGEGPAVSRHGLPVLIGAEDLHVQSVVAHETVGDELLRPRDISVVPNVLEETPDSNLILLVGHHGSPRCCVGYG